MNQVFKGTKYLPVQLSPMDVTGFRIYARWCRQGRPTELSVKVKGISYLSAFHIDETRARRTMTDCHPDRHARVYSKHRCTYLQSARPPVNTQRERTRRTGTGNTRKTPCAAEHGVIMNCMLCILDHLLYSRNAVNMNISLSCH